MLLHKDETAIIEGKRITGDGTWYLVRLDEANRLFQRCENPLALNSSKNNRY